MATISAWPPGDIHVEAAAPDGGTGGGWLLTGYFVGQMNFLSRNVDPLGSSNDTVPRAFAARMARNGLVSWAAELPCDQTSTVCKGNAITPDGKGGALVSGDFDVAAYPELLMPALGFNKLQGSLSHGTTAFMMRVSDHGKIYWARHVFSERYSTSSSSSSSDDQGAAVVAPRLPRRLPPAPEDVEEGNQTETRRGGPLLEGLFGERVFASETARASLTEPSASRPRDKGGPSSSWVSRY